MFYCFLYKSLIIHVQTTVLTDMAMHNQGVKITFLFTNLCVWVYIWFFLYILNYYCLTAKNLQLYITPLAKCMCNTEQTQNLCRLPTHIPEDTAMYKDDNLKNTYLFHNRCQCTQSDTGTRNHQPCQCSCHHAHMDCWCTHQCLRTETTSHL